MALTETYNRFKTWASGNRAQHSQGPFNGLFTRDPFPLLPLKAFNGRIFVMFLERCLGVLKQRDGGLEVRIAHAACTAICCWFDRCERAPRFLSDEQASGIAESGTAFLKCLEILARIGVSEGKLRWKLLPKAHAALMIYLAIVSQIQGHHNNIIACGGLCWGAPIFGNYYFLFLRFL